MVGGDGLVGWWVRSYPDSGTFSTAGVGSCAVDWTSPSGNNGGGGTGNGGTGTNGNGNAASSNAASASTLIAALMASVMMAVSYLL